MPRACKTGHTSTSLCSLSHYLYFYYHQIYWQKDDELRNRIGYKILRNEKRHRKLKNLLFTNFTPPIFLPWFAACSILTPSPKLGSTQWNYKCLNKDCQSPCNPLNRFFCQYLERRLAQEILRQKASVFIKARRVVGTVGHSSRGGGLRYFNWTMCPLRANLGKNEQTIVCNPHFLELTFQNIEISLEKNVLSGFRGRIHSTPVLGSALELKQGFL